MVENWLYVAREDAWGLTAVLGWQERTDVAKRNTNCMSFCTIRSDMSRAQRAKKSNSVGNGAQRVCRLPRKRIETRGRVLHTQAQNPGWRGRSLARPVSSAQPRRPHSVASKPKRGEALCRLYTNKARNAGSCGTPRARWAFQGSSRIELCLACLPN